MPDGPSGTERHRDHAADQGPDHKTRTALGPMQLARDLLEAIAAYDTRSTALAEELVDEILGSEIVSASLTLRELLRTRDPFALTRAVDLAKALLSPPRPMAVHVKSSPT